MVANKKMLIHIVLGYIISNYDIFGRKTNIKFLTTEKLGVVVHYEPLSFEKFHNFLRNIDLPEMSQDLTRSQNLKNYCDSQDYDNTSAQATECYCLTSVILLLINFILLCLD